MNFRELRLSLVVKKRYVFLEGNIFQNRVNQNRVNPPEARHCDGHRAATAGGTATRQRQRGATKRRVGEGLPGGSTY